MRGAHTHGGNAPAKHQKGKPPAGPQLFEKDVAGNLEHGVCDKEHHERDVELFVAHIGRLLQVVVGRHVEDLGIADVGAVEEAEEVDAC